MKLRDYPFEVVQFSFGKCLRNGRYKKSALIEKYTADIPLPDLRPHIAHDYQRVITFRFLYILSPKNAQLLDVNSILKNPAAACQNSCV